MSKNLLLLLDLLPMLVAIGAGYALARWKNLNRAPIQTVLRFLLFPVVLFAFLYDRIAPQPFLVLAGIGAATVAAGTGGVWLSRRYLRSAACPNAALPNIAYFAIPFLALSWNAVGLGAAASVFVGASVGTAALEKNIKSLVREPWIYAVAGAFALQVGGLVDTEQARLQLGVPVSQTGWLAGATTPLVMGGLLLLSLLLGASLHPFGRIQGTRVWLTVGVRLLTGLAVALASIWIFPMTDGVLEALLVVAMAPPAAAALRINRSDSHSGQGADQEVAAANIGTVVALAAMCMLLLVQS